MHHEDARGAELYRLAVANKLIRLGLVKLDDNGQVAPTAALDEMSSPIEPDPIDFRAIRNDR